MLRKKLLFFLFIVILSIDTWGQKKAVVISPGHIFYDLSECTDCIGNLPKGQFTTYNNKKVWMPWRRKCTFEVETNLEIAKELDLLMMDNTSIKTVLLRDENIIKIHSVAEILTLDERVEISNEIAGKYGAKNTLFIAIHNNAGHECTCDCSCNSIGGTEIFISRDPTTNEENLSKLIKEEVVDFFDSPSGRIRKKDFIVLKENKATAVLVECGYFTNPEERIKLGSELWRKRIASGMFEAIIKYFGKEEQFFLESMSSSMFTLSENDSFSVHKKLGMESKSTAVDLLFKTTGSCTISLNNDMVNDYTTFTIGDVKKATDGDKIKFFLKNENSTVRIVFKRKAQKVHIDGLVIFGKNYKPLSTKKLQCFKRKKIRLNLTEFLVKSKIKKENKGLSWRIKLLFKKWFG